MTKKVLKGDNDGRRWEVEECSGRRQEMAGPEREVTGSGRDQQDRAKGDRTTCTISEGVCVAAAVPFTPKRQSTRRPESLS